MITPTPFRWPGRALTDRRRRAGTAAALAGPLLAVVLLAGCGSADGTREPSGVPALQTVESWLYLIDVDVTETQIRQIEESGHDLVVLDFVPSEADNRDFPMADVVERLHTADHPKLVLGYLDVGQAEDYRTYWQPQWRIGDPEWIVALDPDGWEGNYPVAYWWDDYRKLWLGDDGMLASVQEAGFDGVYLDWIEAYSDESVIAAAQRDGVDPRQEMVWWVTDIADDLRSRDPAALVVAQNAAELTTDAAYRDVIDAIAQEQVWFDGGADNDPPGDCPLPRTEDDVESDEYVASLEGGCLRLYEDYPESTLHVSSESYLDDLTAARAAGLVVLTVDYATDPDNVAWVYETSRALGFVPFVGSRSLDRFVAPYDGR